MAAKHRRTLYEAMQASKGDFRRPVPVVPRGAPPVKPDEKPRLQSEPPRLHKELPLLHPRARPAIVSPTLGPRVALAAGVVVVVALVVLLIVQLVGGDRFAGDRRLQTMAELHESPIDSQALANTGKVDLATRTLATYQGPAQPGDGKPGDTPPPGQGTASEEPKPTGIYRVRILATTKDHEKEVDRVAKFLADNGVKTFRDLDRSFYLLYTSEGFAKASDPAANKLLARVKELGKTYRRQSGTSTDFGDAYITEKVVP